MKFQFISYIIPLFISFSILIGLAFYGYRHLSIRGAKTFTISMIIDSLWTLGNALEMSGTNLATKLFWANLQYFAYCFAPLAWLVMVLQFTDREHWANKRNIMLMSIIPVITIILVWTDYFHGMVRYNLILDTSEVFPVISKNYGIWFWVHFGYSYLLNFGTIFLLLRTFLLKNTVYRKQSFYLLIGFLIIFFCNIMYVVGLSPFSGFDISPVFFSISGIIIAWGIFHFRLFDLVPIARATVIEKMGSGIIVIDKIKRIIDINPRARMMLNLPDRVNFGQSLLSIFPELEGLIPEKGKDGLTQTEFTLKDKNGEVNYYELYLSVIRDCRNEHIAWILIINDITDLRLAREEINKQKQELAVMDERERLARDLHDNLGQILGFSNIQIQAVRQELKKENLKLADQYLQRLNEIIKNAHKDIREYVYNIRNNLYYKKDFIVLLKEEIEKFKEKSDFEVKCVISEGITLETIGTEEKLQLIYIVKEALTNILKHAEVDNAKILLNKKGKLIELIIEDNGKGIYSLKNSGSGLNIMNERAMLIGGELIINSKPGKGTKIIVNFPA